MKDIKIDNDGDMSISDYNIEMVNGTDEIIQQLKAIFSTNQGEWFMNEEYGLNYDNILQKKPNIDLIRDEIRNGLSQCSRVYSIDYVNVVFDKENRSLEIEFQATDIEGNNIENTQEFSI